MPTMRYSIIDTLRGLALCNMILYHLFWDLTHLQGVDLPWLDTVVGFVWQQGICWTFILLAGFCQGLGQQQLRRGLIVSIMGILVTIVTYLVGPDAPIVFGILSFLGLAMLLTTVLAPYLRRVSAGWGIGINIFLFAATKLLNEGYLGFGNWRWYHLPSYFYEYGYFSSFWGFQAENFYSADYFSLFPWWFLFLIGYYLEHLPLVSQALQRFSQGENKNLAWLGRHSLGVYLVHQPLIILVLRLYF